MNNKNIMIMITSLSIINTLILVISLITANITIFIMSILLNLINIVLAFKNRKILLNYVNSDLFCKGRFKEDERSYLIKNKANDLTLGISLTTIIYFALGIFVLRNTYSNLLLIGYTLIVTAIFITIIQIISTRYYNHYY